MSMDVESKSIQAECDCSAVLVDFAIRKGIVIVGSKSVRFGFLRNGLNLGFPTFFQPWPSLKN